MSLFIYLFVLVPEGLHDRSLTEDHILVPKLLTRCLYIYIYISICILVPEGLHDRSPIFLGSTEDVQDVLQVSYIVDRLLDR